MKVLIFKMSKDKESIWSALPLSCWSSRQKSDGYKWSRPGPWASTREYQRYSSVQKKEGSTVMLSKHWSWEPRMQWFISVLKFPKCHHIAQPEILASKSKNIQCLSNWDPQLFSFPAYNSIIQPMKFPLSLHLCQVLLIAKEKDVKLSHLFLSNS